jgi:hypothetical protein
VSEKKAPLRVALVGVPNCGKTALFNRLTGSRQKVANYAGVTVERKEGTAHDAASGRTYRILDLPGAYSLAASQREVGAADAHRDRVTARPGLGDDLHGLAGDESQLDQAQCHRGAVRVPQRRVILRYPGDNAPRPLVKAGQRNRSG